MTDLRPPYPIPTEGIEDDAVTSEKIKDGEIVNADVNAAAAIATSKLATKPHIFVPYNAKIADINEADINKHFLDLETALGETRKIVALTVLVIRIAGTGNFVLYPNEGFASRTLSSYGVWDMFVIADGTQRAQYRQTVADDDWDLWCLGYVVEA